MIHSSNAKPKVFPFGGTSTPAEIDRLQDMTASVTLNRTKIEEIGRDGVVDWKSSNPSISLSLKQLEYGSLEFYQMLANTANTKVELKDFKTSQVDIAAYKTDDSGSFLGTIWYPKLRLSGFNVNIGDPDALIERNFSLIGEDEITLQNNNKYFIWTQTNPTTGLNSTITVSNPSIVADPDNSGRWIFKVIRIRSGVATELNFGTEWSCTSTTLTINGQSYASDTIKYCYSAASYTTGSEPFTANNTDLAGISADSASIYLIDSGNYLYRLQSAAIDVSLSRYDLKEIGNNQVVQRGVRDITVRVTLGRLLETYTIEEVMRGVAGISFGKLDPRKYSDNLTLLIKLYSSYTKSTFKLGYKFTTLSPVGVDAGTPLNDYLTRGVTLEGKDGLITNSEALM